ncbi:Ankyrin repeat domain-containing protein 39 [Tetrabaena socialis]|uniref:Ankyrin repeat domain-containing protein 39 n=1 Tax=Tetrabaena socialis TaxID=47790 RepID=A0A2J7ZNI9_9CHLO|nr:Ankyrin repeat domain-containing protein 39 [Tetrabaena socialis]|eukprot:PNH01818.1 Ankyrin repeat domain-containing protein 39 [Tetrabaena socialis]
MADWSAFCAAHASGACKCALVATGTEQSLDELEFSRSACSAAQNGDVAKLRRILQRNPQAVHGDGGSGLGVFASYEPPPPPAGGSYTPLHYAARGGRLEAVELLLSSGADVNAQTRGMGATPLHRAAMQGHASVVEAL